MTRYNLSPKASIATLISFLALALPAFADTFTATATVNNTITMTETQALNFGDIYAISSATASDQASMTMTTGGTISYGGTPTDAVLISLGGHQPGIIDITGMAPSTPLTVVTDNFVNLTNGNPSSATFALTVVDDTGGTITTDASGNATINIGGTITTEVTANPYNDGVYTGSYDVTVSY